jgi:hypothetical protein
LITCQCEGREWMRLVKHTLTKSGMFWKAFTVARRCFVAQLEDIPRNHILFGYNQMHDMDRFMSALIQLMQTWSLPWSLSLWSCCLRNYITQQFVIQMQSIHKFWFWAVKLTMDWTFQVLHHCRRCALHDNDVNILYVDLYNVLSLRCIWYTWHVSYDIDKLYIGL